MDWFLKHGFCRNCDNVSSHKMVKCKPMLRYLHIVEEKKPPMLGIKHVITCNSYIELLIAQLNLLLDLTNHISDCRLQVIFIIVSQI